jgi:adenylate cyclase
MKKGEFLRSHAELLLLITVLVVISGVFHWIPYKLAFLSFFYLPVLAAGCLFGARRAVLTGCLCVLVVVVYYFWTWAKAALAAEVPLQALSAIVRQDTDILLNVAMWGGFLILTGGVVGRVHEKLLVSYSRARELNDELEQRASQLQEANQSLEASATELKQQSEKLQEKNLLIEKLRQQVEETLYSAMDSTVARLIIQGRLRQEKRILSVLFCDLKGFTEYAHTLHPEVILEDLNQFYGVMEEIIETYRGHIDKYMGDGIMCQFGAPVEYEQHCLQAVAAALKMQQRFQQEAFPWSLRIGIASGESIVGLLGRRRRSYSVIGEVANLAKRLEGLCAPGHVYIDGNTWARVKHLLQAERVTSLGRRREKDQEVLTHIAELKEKLKQTPNDPELLFSLGKLSFDICEASEALNYFQRVLALRPDDMEAKVAFADASVKRDEFEKIMIPGLKERRAVYSASGLAHPLLRREAFPKSFYEQYHHVEEMVEIPDDVTLPTEVLDGSVGHSLAVAVLSYAVADQMDLPADLKRSLLIAGRLQDLGKSTVWHHILNRRGSLSEKERRELENHVEESVSVAKRMGYDRPEVIEIIANHHELLNGSGYPRGLKGEEIPLGARIGCLADVYCALTAWRPYRDAWDQRVALSELRKEAAKGKYDEQVVDTLCNLLTPADVVGEVLAES